MIADNLTTTNPAVRLVKPEVQRDAILGVKWLGGTSGYNTLKLMGVPDEQNKATTLEEEQQRVSEFISNEHQLNWMIQYKSQIVGTVWVDLESNTQILAPAVSIMIGEPDIRGKGIGQASLDAVIEYLMSKNYPIVYSRHLVENIGSKKLLHKVGFTKLGQIYTDEDGLAWQNVRRMLN